MVEWAAAALSVGVALAGLALAWFMYLKRPTIPAALASRFSALYRLLWNKYWVDELYELVVVKPIHGFSRFLWKSVDEKVIDGTCVEGSAHLVVAAGGLIRKAQTGAVSHYAFWIFVGVTLLFGYFAYGPW